MRVLLSRRTILAAAIFAILCWIATIIITRQTIHCTPTAHTAYATCSAGTGVSAGAVGATIFSLLAWVATVVVWLMSLVKLGRIRHWIWFIVCLLLPPVGQLLYGAFGPDLPAHGQQLTYIEGTPRDPVTT